MEWKESKMNGGIYFFYIIALIPALIGTVLFMCHKKVIWQEWLGGTIIAFLISAIMHGIAIHSMTADKETWSGKISHICHFPKWTERYTQTHTETYIGSDGKSHTRTYTTTEYDTHSEHWVAYLDFGTISEERRIDLNLFNSIKVNFGGKTEDGGKQPSHHFGGCKVSGDNNIYRTPNTTGYIYPVTTTKYFENKVKASPTLFSFATVPTNAPVYNWPENPNWMVSDRLLGAIDIDLREFDLMNSRLGPTKRVNVIMVAFNSADSMLGQWQQAKWIGGKKNDLVLTYGFQGSNVVWSYCFGWTEQDICKRNLETILLSNPINDSILPLIEQEIRSTYIKKDWHKFDYITIEPPTWSYIVLVILMLITQIGFWFGANVNEFNK